MLANSISPALHSLAAKAEPALLPNVQADLSQGQQRRGRRSRQRRYHQRRPGRRPHGLRSRAQVFPISNNRVVHPHNGEPAHLDGSGPFLVVALASCFGRRHAA